MEGPGNFSWRVETTMAKQRIERHQNLGIGMTEIRGLKRSGRIAVQLTGCYPGKMVKTVKRKRRISL